MEKHKLQYLNMQHLVMPNTLGNKFHLNLLFYFQIPNLDIVCN